MFYMTKIKDNIKVKSHQMRVNIKRTFLTIYLSKYYRHRFDFESVFMNIFKLYKMKKLVAISR